MWGTCVVVSRPSHTSLFLPSLSSHHTSQSRFKFRAKEIKRGCVSIYNWSGVIEVRCMSSFDGKICKPRKIAWLALSYLHDTVSTLHVKCKTSGALTVRWIEEKQSWEKSVYSKNLNATVYLLVNCYHCFEVEEKNERFCEDKVVSNKRKKRMF